MNQTEEPSYIAPDPEENTRDTKTGKTISRKRAAIIAGGAMAAGSLANDLAGTPGIGDIKLDTDGDGTADTVLTDLNEDGIYEMPTDAVVETSAPVNETQPFNPYTAPVAGPGTIDDSMSFSEAFAAAREELGPGGVFAWHGQYYNTFYAEELNDSNHPVVDYDVTDQHGLEQLDDYTAPTQDDPSSGNNDQESVDPESSPDVMAADFDMDGTLDAVYVDINEDGSADAVYTDVNLDGTFTEDEVQLIHDPETLERPDTATDGSMMAADTNMDGVDDILLADMEGDQVADAVGIDQNSDMMIDESEIIVLNPDAMEGAASGEVEYSGEIATDMPEDVSDEVLDQMGDDVANLEDNFDEINNWS